MFCLVVSFFSFMDMSQDRNGGTEGDKRDETRRDAEQASSARKQEEGLNSMPARIHTPYELNSYQI